MDTRFAATRHLLCALTATFTLCVSCSASAWCNKEIVQAREIARTINEGWPLRPRDDPLNEKITRIAKVLGHHAEPSTPSDWQLRIIRNLAPYAYAIGAGQIYVTDGTAEFTHNESELAAIIAHEMGHQLAGHFCIENTKTPWKQFRELIATGENDKPVRYREIGTASLVIDIDKEKEADAIAVKLLKKSGYNPQAMLEVTRRLPGPENPDPRRIAALETLLK